MRLCVQVFGAFVGTRRQLSTLSVRINKALKATHSRRETDALVAAGAVEVNGVHATHGMRLGHGDIVRLHGAIIDWERLNPATATACKTAAETSTTTTTTSTSASTSNGTSNSNLPRRNQAFVYLRYWKPVGVIVTTDRRVKHNVLDAIGRLPFTTDRVYPIGRLDKDTSGRSKIQTNKPLSNQDSARGH